MPDAVVPNGDVSNSLSGNMGIIVALELVQLAATHRHFRSPGRCQVGIRLRLRVTSLMIMMMIFRNFLIERCFFLFLLGRKKII